MTSCDFKPIDSRDQNEIMDIFNYYIENSYAAFPEQPLPYEAFNYFMQQAKGYPSVAAKNESGVLVGFGLMRPHNTQPAFDRTAEVTTFIHPDHTGQGLGSQMLNLMLDDACRQKLTCILAAISSLNEGSVRFHQRHGFQQCGCFRQAAYKNGQSFDVIWMQRLLD